VKRKHLGKKGEDLALTYLKKKGYRFVDRNFSCPFGEIDLIVKDKNTLVFVEVKTRWSQKFGSPEEAVTPRKLQSIIKTAQFFVCLNPSLPKKHRIDVVAISVDSNGRLKSLRHIMSVT
jgi:putative endonuclease